MTDIDFEIIDSNSIETSRSRRPKYKHKVWEYNNAKDEARYLLAIARMHERNGSDYCDELRSKVSSRIAYEIELETVLPAYIDNDIESVHCEDDDYDSAEEFTLSENLNSIIDIPLGNRMVVLTPFVFDSVSNRITCKIPCGVVTKKIDLQDLIVVVLDYIEEAPVNSKMMERLNILFNWVETARETIDQLNDYVNE